MMRFIGDFNSKIVMAILLAVACFVTTSAQTSAPEYAILIVGDEGSAEMLRQEKVMIAEMAKTIRKQKPEQRLPIFSYHFNKERERAYCETKLNVLDEDLLFVGVVELKNKVPLKVVYRVDRINNPTRAANDILVRADELTAQTSGAVQASPNEGPAVSPDSSSSTSSSVSPGSGFRVQLGSFAQLKYAQDKIADVKRENLAASILEFQGPDGDSLYKVLSPLMRQRDQADALLQQFQDAGFEEAFLVRAGNS